LYIQSRRDEDFRVKKETKDVLPKHRSYLSHRADAYESIGKKLTIALISECRIGFNPLPTGR
jgi:hypothetical protein